MTASPITGPITAAIVDDHPVVRHGIQGIINTGRPDINVLYSGDSLAKVTEMESLPTLLFLDLDLGDTSADPEVVKQLVDDGCIVLIVSAMGQDSHARQMLQAGASGFVTKTDAADELLDAIASVLDGTLWASADVATVLNSFDEDIGFTAQEKEVLRLAARGYKIAAIGRSLNVSPHTVKTYLKRIRERLMQAGRPAPTRTDLYKEAVRAGLVDPEK